ncbi:hypothetical protein [Tissierella creatinophila]|uniref:Uncharacterized protein n=1 Tax=Tissierella creatinophila DSM 6911 TaxID=1123403 RepID=A0A1U7M5W7_TISCR|nr:hypothetical protein [Tissierella creatinophila]OLS02681.1 hypothetical protein TICRE_13260 [Tissierella creatinophila DSM 6911]
MRDSGCSKAGGINFDIIEIIYCRKGEFSGQSNPIIYYWRYNRFKKYKKRSEIQTKLNNVLTNVNKNYKNILYLSGPLL